MSTGRFRMFFLFCSLLFAASLSWAQLPPLSDADMKFSAVPGQPGAAAAVLYREEIYDDLHNHSATIQQRIKILTEEGRKYADVVLPYDKKHFPVHGLTGRTIHADGKVIPFEGKPFDKVLFKGKYLRYNVKSFTLPDVQVGSIIEYKYSLIYPDHQLFAPRWLVQGDIFQKQVKFRFYFYQDDVGTDHDQTARGIAWTVRLPKGMDTKEVTMPNHDVYVELAASDVPAYVDEPYMPDNDQFKFNVHFYYKVTNKPQEYWAKQAKFWQKDVEKFLGGKDGVAEAAAKITSPTDTPEQKARKIYAFVTGLENDDFLPARTEQELKALKLKEVSGAQDILNRKRGDSEELTRLYVALARAAGLNAYVMRVTNREDSFYDPSYLEFHQLDDEVAIVQVDGKDIFLDPGAKFAPFGVLDWRHTETQGYRQTTDKPALASTPNPTYKDAIIHRVARFKINPDYTVAGPMRVTYHGFFAITKRQTGGRTDDEGRKKQLEDDVKSWLPTDAEVKLTSQPNWSDVEKPLVADFSVSTAIASNAGKRVLFPAHAFQYGKPAMFPHAERVNGVYLYFPSREVDEVSLTLPPGMAIESLPKEETFKLDYAMYTASYKGEGQTVTSFRDVAMNAYAFPKERYSEVKGFYDKVKTNDEQQVILRGVSNAVAGN